MTEQASTQGPKVRKGKHPRGDQGVRKSVEEIIKDVEKGRLDPKTVAWARETWDRAGRPIDKMQTANALLIRLRAERGFIEDPVDAEFVVSSACTLDGCDGLTFLGEDCDGLLIAFLAACEAVGIEAAVVNHAYDREGNVLDHVLGALYDRPQPGEKRQGKWIRVDPSTSQPIGTVSKPTRERMFLVPGGKLLCDTRGGFCPDAQLERVGAVRENLRPEGDFVGVGRPSAGVLGQKVEPVFPAVTEAFKRYMLDELEQAFEQTLSQWRLLELRRAEMEYVVHTLGEPLVQDPVAGQTNWTPEMERDFQNLRYIIPLYLGYVQDAREGKREFLWNESEQNVVIVGEPGETAIVVQDGIIHTVDTSGVDTTEAAGSVGEPLTLTVGTALAIGGVVIVGLGLIVVASYIQYKMIDRAAEIVAEVAETVKVQKAVEWGKKRVDAGEDPEKVNEDVENLLAASGERLKRRRDEAEKKDPIDKILDSAKLGLYAFGAVGGLTAIAYGLSQVAKLKGRG